MCFYGPVFYFQFFLFYLLKTLNARVWFFGLVHTEREREISTQYPIIEHTFWSRQTNENGCYTAATQRYTRYVDCMFMYRMCSHTDTRTHSLAIDRDNALETQLCICINNSTHSNCEFPCVGCVFFSVVFCTVENIPSDHKFTGEFTDGRHRRVQTSKKKRVLFNCSRKMDDTQSA